MGTTYTRATDDGEEMQLLMDMMQEHHQRLLMIKTPVSFALMFAMPEEDENTGEPKSPAVTHNGYPCAAVTRKIQLKQRAMGLPDAEITVDEYQWDRMSREEKEALLDHELTHIDLVYKENEEQYDDLGRPRIKLRKHDYQFGWFTEVAQRHGRASIEHQQAKQWMTLSGQLYLDFGELTTPEGEKVQIATASADA